MAANRWMSLGAALALLCLAICGGPAARATEPDSDVIPSESYTHPNQLVAVEGNRRMNLLCVGHGTPVVLFDAGSGFDLITWRHVQGQVGKFTRSCAFDRAGYGFSEDVHRLLRAAAITGGVLYVGHSGGGLYAQFLQKLHPEDLAGAVLVDPAFPGFFKTTLVGLSAAQARLAMAPPAWIKEISICLALARQGALVAPSTDQEKACAYPAWYPEPVDELLHGEIARRFSTPKLWRARQMEIENIWPASGLLSRDDHELPVFVSFGDKPLAVVTHGNWYDRDDDATPGVQAAQFAAWISAHDALVARSSKGVHLVAQGSGHFIQTDQPQIVVDAIRQVFDELSAARRN
jgi:pimeloyl-ACP methyl ester carboxylesterase